MSTEGESGAELVERIVAALADGRKIEAVKLYREATGRGLKESKDAVEAIERGQNPPAAWIGPTDTLDPELQQRMVDELTAGRKIEAIKIYRQARHCGLKEAKEAVEQFAKARGLPCHVGGGCGTVAAAVMCAIGGGCTLLCTWLH
ncbi:MAG: hypothetical protein AB7O62_02435 [Pirellulales bacterium]